MLKEEDDDFFIATRNGFFYHAVDTHKIDPQTLTFLRSINANTDELGCAMLIHGHLVTTLYPSDVEESLVPSDYEKETMTNGKSKDLFWFGLCIAALGTALMIAGATAYAAKPITAILLGIIYIILGGWIIHLAATFKN
jgi:hypothetical protein